MTFGQVGRRWTTVVGVLVVAACLVAATATAAGNPTVVGSDDGWDAGTPAVTPLGASTAPVTVVVQTGGDAVAVQESNAGHTFSAAEKKSAAAALKAQQQPVEAAAQQLGGTIVGDYQYAYTGFKVSIGRDKLDQLAALKGVVGVHRLELMTPDNSVSVPFIGAPAVWDGLNGLHGEHVKVGIIDTGIDYTNADFGGPGTVDAYQQALASDTLAPSTALFGPLAPAVKGGIDLVGDNYNAASSDPAKLIPHPDANPLDCGGHGSHTAGTAAGRGILADGSTYTGPYNATTVSSHSWTVGPGVAPQADIYAIRVFGCAGSTDATIDAIEWAVANDMDVINMSLGSPFGTADDPSAVAADNASKTGMIVVASAGNSGTNPYITGSPAAGTGAISVAAVDSTASFPGAAISGGGLGSPVPAINANGADLSAPITAPVKVLTSGTSIALGCDPADYAGTAGKIVVTARGTCARVARAIYGQQAGAVAVIMVNNTTSYPPFEGQITSNPDTSAPYTVTIPFLGVKSTSSSSAKNDAIKGLDGKTVTISAASLANPAFKAYASFTSGGARNGDSILKPEISAPGVSIVSAGMGTGHGYATMSGTSMAAPHVAGVAALVKQAHPDWNKGEDLKAAIVNTASAAMVSGFNMRVGGAGIVQPLPATLTQVAAVGDLRSASLSFGFKDLQDNFSETRQVKLRNHGSSDATFTIGLGKQAGPQSVAVQSSVTVPAGGAVEVPVTLNVTASSLAQGSTLQSVSGLVTFTPAAGSNNGVSLAVPYYLVPRADSRVSAKFQAGKLRDGSGTMLTSNNGIAAGNADYYAWGLSDGQDKGSSPSDLRAVGVQAFPFDASNQLVVFAINGWNSWSTAATQEYDTYVDVNNDGHWDYIVLGIDRGEFESHSWNGQLGSYVYDLRTNKATIKFNATAPTNSSTVELPVLTSQLCAAASPCLDPAHPRFTYATVVFDLLSGASDDAGAQVASFNPWSSSISQGQFDTLPVGASASEPVAVDAAEWAHTPALGLMVVSLDNKAGADEASLVPVK